MNHQRFFVSPESIDLTRQRIFVSDAKLARQISKVLRLRQGDRLDFLDGTGKLYQATLEECDRNSVEAQLINCIEPNLGVRKKPSLSLVFAPLRHGRFEWALEKLTELGADRICPVIFARSVSRPSDKGRGERKSDSGDQAEFSRDHDDSTAAESGGTKTARWQAIIKEAAEQCERLVLPHLVPVQSFEEFLKAGGQIGVNEVRLICAERRDAPFLSVVLCNQRTIDAATSITIAVGAEGGFTSQEIDQALSFGYLPVSLGANILRAETAIVYALAIVASQLEAPLS